MKLPLFFLKASIYLLPAGLAELIARLSSGVSFLVRLFAVVVVAISLPVLMIWLQRYNFFARIMRFWGRKIESWLK